MHKEGAMPALKELHEEYTTRMKEIRDLAAKAEVEERDFSADERQEVIRRTEELKGLKAKITEAKGDDELRKAIGQLGDDIGVPGDIDSGRDVASGRTGKGKSLGEQFVSSPEFKAFMGKFPNGRIPDSAKGIMSPPVQFKDVVTGVSDTSGGAFVENDYTGMYEPLGRRTLTLRDLVSTRQTGSDTVEFVRQTTKVDAAAPVAEATTAEGPTANTTTGAIEDAAGAGKKPEGSMAVEKVTASVRTIAVWIPATKRALSDASQLRGLIDDELRADLEEELEDQILNGDGNGENFAGIANTAGIQTQAYSATVTGLDPLLETTRKAKTKVKFGGGRSVPSGYLMNPADWEKIDLARMAKNPANEATAGGVPTLHGVPVVESEGVTEGVGYVGDFRKSVLWDREQATIQVSDSHADFFIRNLVAVLAELRAAFGVIRPAAFVEIDLTAA